MRCSTYLQMSCSNRKLWNAHVNPNVRRGLLRAMANVKSTKHGDVNRMTETKKSKHKKEPKYISEKNTLWAGEESQKTKEYDRCIRCGRKLKNPEYRQRGYGAVCWEKRIQRKKQSLF